MTTEDITTTELDEDASTLARICAKYATSRFYLKLRTGIALETQKERANGLIQIADLVDALWDKAFLSKPTPNHRT